MTDLAVRDLQGRRASLLERCRSALVSIFGRTSDHHLPRTVSHLRSQRVQAVPRPAVSPPRTVRLVTPAPPVADVDMRWQRHPQLRSRQAERAPMPGTLRSARLEAERGMILARGGKLAEAVEAFSTAARDPGIDLSALPGFWDLPRTGMMTAVRAYEQVNRLRDAAALDARIRHLLRPRALRPVPAARAARLTASGD